MDGARETGLRLFEEVYGTESAAGLKAYMETDDFGVECAVWSTEFCFGQVWSRAALDRKLRSCVVLGMMIALRQHEEIGYHTRMGMANGLTEKEIEEILYTSVPYCGLPASNVARAAMKEALARTKAPR
jgi:4-carboxymuconolactone decarboxylase